MIVVYLCKAYVIYKAVDAEYQVKKEIIIKYISI